jgi:hypothetical protein
MGSRRVRKEHEALLAASASESTPLLLELARQQAARRRPADLLGQYARDQFVQPSFLDQRLATQLDALALNAAASYEALLLSPVAPLGSCSVLAPTSQNRTLSTTRGSEVVSDPTNVLALECARRLRDKPATPVRLCTVHQVVRAQPMPDKPGITRHFRLFVLAEAGPARADDGFELDAIANQLAVFDRLFDALTTSLDCRFPGRRAVVLATPSRDTLAARVLKRLTETLPHVGLVQQPLAKEYYDGIRVMFGADTIDGEWNPIADLGRFDWMSKLTSNRRQRYVASGFGLQRAPVAFRAGQ